MLVDDIASKQITQDDVAQCIYEVKMANPSTKQAGGKVTDADEELSDIPDDWYRSNDFIEKILHPESVNRSIFIDSGVMVSKDPLARNTLIKQAIPYILASKYPDMLSKLSSNLSETIIDCTYAGIKCDMERDFSTEYYPEYGNCFTYNWNKTKISYQAGEPQGLSVALSGSVDATVCSSTVMGFRMEIHSQDIHAFPSTIGLFVPTNFQSVVAITGQTFDLLSSPYGDCVQDPEILTDFYTGNYSVQGCLQSCIQTSVMNRCGCAYPIYASPNDSVSCPLEKISCVDETTKCTKEIANSCNCPQPCHNAIYGAAMSRLKLLHHPLLLSICKSKGIPSNRCIKTLGTRIADVNVYFNKISMIHYEEMPSYASEEMLADIGGSMGIWIGASVITITELLLLPIMLFFG